MVSYRIKNMYITEERSDNTGEDDIEMGTLVNPPF